MASYYYTTFAGWSNNTPVYRTIDITAKAGMTHVAIIDVEGQEQIVKPVASRTAAQAAVRRELKKADAQGLEARGTWASLTQTAFPKVA